jgi:hypothetical protein
MGSSAAWAQTRTFGSTLRNTPNLPIGPDLAPRLDAITGVPTLLATGQTTCTMRFLGYIGNVRRLGSVVPGNGVITKVRIRSGSNPAPVRVVIMQGSAGLYGTLIRKSRVFRLRPNAVTTLTVNLPVRRTYTLCRAGLQQVTDAVGLSAVGLGTLPFHDSATAGTFATGSGLTQLWYPQLQRNQIRILDGYVDDGLELLMQWDFVAGSPGVN